MAAGNMRLGKVGLEEYGLNNVSLINNKTWAEVEVTLNTGIPNLRQALFVEPTSPVRAMSYKCSIL